MRIGVDATCWANERGYGRFTRELVRAMVEMSPDDVFVCFLDPSSAACFDLARPNVRRVVVDLSEAPAMAASASGSRGVADLFRMTRAVSKESLDVFFSPSVYTYFPLPPRLPAIVTIHDAIAERYPHLTLPSRKARMFWRMKVRLAIMQARRILTVSEYAAADIARNHSIPRERIRIALEAPAVAYRPSSRAEIAAAASTLGLPNGAGWFLYVGGFNPHKNVPYIVRAHATLAKELGRGAPMLLLVGTLDRDVFHGDQAAIRRTIEDCGTDSLVRWTGFLDDDELRHVHSGAIALVLPSDSEGFGLPAVEAAACGTPVIATTESPLPELLRAGGIFVRPRDHESLLAAMRTMASDADARATFAAGALAAARSLDWSTGAAVALAAIREAAA